MKNNRQILTAFFLIASICIASCRKSFDQPAIGPKMDSVEKASMAGLTATYLNISISPNFGPHSTYVTIKGSNFGSLPAAIEVRFNGLIARIFSVEDTRIVAIVPRRAGVGNVTVKTPTTQITGPVFNYTWSTTVITPEVDPSDSYFPLGSFSGGICLDTTFDKDVLFVSSYNSIVRIYSPAESFSNRHILFDGDFNDPLNRPVGLVHSRSNVSVVDANNHRIHSVDDFNANGYTSTVGTGVAGYANGSGDNAQFNLPWGITGDRLGNLYVTEKGSSRIRKITPFSSVVSNIAGTGIPGFRDGPVSTAQFNRPNGIAIDNSGNIYVSDTYNHRIRKINPFGVVSTFAGSGLAGFADGPGTTAKFNYPAGLIIDKKGNLYVADEDNHRIRMITQDGTVSTFAGCGIAGKVDGDASVARFRSPAGLAENGEGDFFIVDKGNNVIRRIIIE